MKENSPSEIPPSAAPRVGCHECGATLPADQTEGLCPRCLMVGALSPTRDGSTAPPTPAPEEIAAHFPGLEILECLGRGGMGIVYKARQPQLDRFVALKILPREHAPDPSFAERFRREARALARLSHPNIVGVHDFGETGDFFYFLMEYVDGANLRQLQDGQRLEPGQALAIVPKLCEALQYAHDEGVVHRDIKPENILIDTRGRVKIADFGLARLLGADAPGLPLTKSRQVMGTPHYMAPEQMEGNHAVDHRADIYSLGVVFYEMLTGSLPLGRFEPPSHRVEVDVRLDEIVLRSLERKPELRYQQAGEVKTAVEGVASTAPVSPASPVKPLESVSLPQFSATAIIGAFFAVLSILALAASIYTYFEEPRPETTLASLCALAATAITASVLGLAALNRLRLIGAARGRLGLAFADAATFPLHALNFAVFGLCLLAVDWFESPTSATRKVTIKHAIAVAVPLALLLDAWILRRSWRALTGKPRSRPPVPAGWRRALAVAGAVVLVAGLAFLALRNPLLLRAAKSRGTALAETLLALGANPNAGDSLGIPALLKAIEHDDLPTARVLLRHGADADKASPLAWAAALGLDAAVRELLDAGAIVDQPLHHNITPLMLASATGRTNVVHRLLAAGADVDARDSGITADAYIISNDTGGSGNSAGSIDYRWPGKHLTSLMLAAHGGHVEIVRILLEAGADPRIADAGGRFAKDYVGAANHDAIENLLFAASARVLESAEPPGPRALVEAAAAGQTGTVRALLREGADVNDKDADGRTALAAAAANGHVATVLSLILLGANPDDSDTLGRTPLILAAENGQAAVIRALYDFEAALAAARRETENDPDNALPKLRERITGVDVRLFDEIGARLPDFRVNTSAQDRSGQSAFMKAAAKGHIECGLALLGWKDGPLQDKDGRTAAMLAAMNGQADFIRAMIRNPTTSQGTGNGTTLTYHAMLAPEALALTDTNGQTAIALAEASGHGEIADLLRGELHAIIDHCSAVFASDGASTPRSVLEIRDAAQAALGEPVGEGDKPTDARTLPPAPED